MAYQPNSNKGYAPKQNTQEPAKQTTAQTNKQPEGKGNNGTWTPSSPIGTMTFCPAGSKDYQEVGAVFENVTQKGKTYMRIKDKEGNSYQIFLHAKKES